MRMVRIVRVIISCVMMGIRMVNVLRGLTVERLLMKIFRGMRPKLNIWISCMESLGSTISGNRC